MGPGLFFFLFLGFTVLVFAYGPWPWPVQDGTRLFTFLAASHLAFAIGYFFGAIRKGRDYHGSISIPNAVIWSIGVTLFLVYPTMVAVTGKLVPNIIGAIVDPGSAYVEAYLRRQGGGGVVDFARLLVGPFLFAVVPLGIFYWRYCSPWIRGAFIVTSLATVIAYIAIGTNRQIFMTVVLIPFILIAAQCARTLKISRISAVISSVLVISLFTVGAYFFAATQATRPGSFAVNLYFPLTGTFVDSEHPISKNVDDRTKILFNSGTLYIAHGYYALYKALDEPFTPMFGAGNSDFFRRQIERFTGQNDLFQYTYPGKLEAYGWKPDLVWSSAYTYFASDLSFPGTVLLMGVIGFLFALTWLDTLRAKNPFAVAMFANFVLMLLMLPGANERLQDGEGFTAFWVILIAWLLTRQKFVWK
jgi:hypothetical protein